MASVVWADASGMSPALSPMIDDGVPLQSLGAVKRGEHDPVVVDLVDLVRPRRRGRSGAATRRPARRWPGPGPTRRPGTARSPPPWPPAPRPAGRWCGPGRRCWTSAARSARLLGPRRRPGRLVGVAGVGDHRGHGAVDPAAGGGVDLAQHRLVGLAVPEHGGGHRHHLRRAAVVLVQADDLGPRAGSRAVGTAATDPRR